MYRLMALALIVMLSASLRCKAQSDSMYVYGSEGTVSYGVASLDSVVFRNPHYALRPETVRSAAHAVDLGLSVRWADMNVGADEDGLGGALVGWGDASGERLSTALNDYPSSTPPETISGDVRYDIAAAQWGGRWRMPLLEEWNELCTQCTWTLVVRGVQNCWRVEGPNGNSIYLSADGYRNGTSFPVLANPYWFYWTGSLCAGANAYAFGKDWSDTKAQSFVPYARYLGGSVRPVWGDLPASNPVQEKAGEKVDLGLSVLWSSTNLGAATEEEAGDYFAWGETETKDYYTRANSLKRNAPPLRNITNTRWDAAHARWGDKWRTPTRAEYEELINNCTWVWLTQNGVNGYKVVGRNGNTIFLPANGYQHGFNVHFSGTYGGYWSSSLLSEGKASYLYFYSTHHSVTDTEPMFGQNIRPVYGQGTGKDDDAPSDPVEPPTYAVDLGLSVKWASMNVGATSPEDYGGYFAWGETSEKEEYTMDTYLYYNVDIGEDISGTDHDVAHVQWGGTWHMPTYDELKELLDNCTWTWTTQNAVNGYKVTGPNGNSIFLPAAGCYSTGIYGAGTVGNYWTATSGMISSSSTTYVHYLYFYSDYYRQIQDTYGDYRDGCYGRSVRPVCP